MRSKRETYELTPDEGKGEILTLKEIAVFLTDLDAEKSDRVGLDDNPGEWKLTAQVSATGKIKKVTAVWTENS